MRDALEEEQREGFGYRVILPGLIKLGRNNI